MTTAILQKNVLHLNVVYKGSGKFKTGNGWLHNFKQRFGIHTVSILGEKLSSDVDASVELKSGLMHFFTKNEYDEEYIYNADETGFY